ncbi:uracil-DNA glycosylase [Aneurinibacillus migulanus]|uniref:uracil-DNA glycosylase n=1 Tax=Aneurinibacillus migulanus TaxID=47500 RepID=UPI0005BA30E2|nr:uracil-DNA glycosylase [Aneurinibacillus migulanus]KIV53796.1 uracil-DNA glycosylase [Aneurinibacillus migulanus]KPD04648.1 uracil-DNA glycosylase [Aneurinibacillus migulanus]MCP1356906.1 uracil-DNA glycosylase [Aneurinibacillus migulanus]CEH30446.1 Uracil-DNA glycosylase superfamily protein [Aneurinibacillus migulanus]
MYPEKLVEQCMKRIQPYACEGFVWGKGPENPTFMLVGEAPGATEIEKGEPFIGRAGEMLNQFLDHLGITREEIYITSVVRSRPYKFETKHAKDGTVIQRKANRTPNQKEILAHAPLLDYQIATIRPKLIVTMGTIALHRLLGKEHQISADHGTLLHTSVLKLDSMETNTYSWTDQQYNVFPTYHPASIFYNRKLLDEIYEDLDKLRPLLHSLHNSAQHMSSK